MTVTADSSLRRIVKNVGLLSAAGAVSSVLLTIQGLVAARILGVEVYGLFAVISAAALFISQFLDVRTWEAITKFLPELLTSRDEPTTGGLIRLGILIDLLTGTLSLGLTWALSSFIAVEVVHRPDANVLIVLFAIGLPFTVIANGTTAAVLRVLDRFQWISIKSIVIAALRLALTIGFLATGFGLAGLIVAHLLAELMNAVTALILTRLALNASLGRHRAASIHKVFLRLRGLSALLAQTSISSTLKGVHGRADILVLSLLASPMEVGYYRAALDLAGVVSKLSSPMQLAIMPELSRLSAARLPIGALARRITVILSIFIPPLVLSATLFSEQIVILALGRSYTPSAWPFAILVWGYSISLAFIWVRAAVVIRQMVGLMNLVAAGIALLDIAMLFVLVPAFGATGAALSTSVVYATVPLLTLVLISRPVPATR